jgi:hypothetical protein
MRKPIERLNPFRKVGRWDQVMETFLLSDRELWRLSLALLVPIMSAQWGIDN